MYGLIYTFYLAVPQGIVPLMPYVIFTVLPPVYPSKYCINVKNIYVHSQSLENACNGDLAKISMKEKVLMALHISCTQKAVIILSDSHFHEPFLCI